MIRMEHLNHHANLYAGRGIEWMVESAFMAACLTHGDKNGLLYKNMRRFDFSRSVEPGDIVRYESTVVRAGQDEPDGPCGSEKRPDRHRSLCGGLVCVHSATIDPGDKGAEASRHRAG